MSTIKTNQLAHTATGAATFTLPTSDGSANQLLKTDGSGNLGWATDQGGKLIKFNHSQSRHNFTTTSSSYQNISYLNLTVTPSSSSNLLFFQYALQARIYLNGGNDAMAWIAISDDAGSSYLAENYHRTYDYGGSGALLDIGCSGYHVKTAGSTSQRTYYIYVRINSSGTFELNMAANQNNSVCTVTEIEP
jgi:hypothetical protein|tara:strand:- start:325 stop:897 length:573 start_codon:yes stop_codon:yes gene_type:complete